MVKYHLIKLKNHAKEDIATTMLALTTTPCSSSSGRDSDRTLSTLSTMTAEGSNGMPKGILLGNNKDNKREQQQHETRGE
jgi:hypothetical protein